MLNRRLDGCPAYWFGHWYDNWLKVFIHEVNPLRAEPEFQSSAYSLASRRRLKVSITCTTPLMVSITFQIAYCRPANVEAYAFWTVYRSFVFIMETILQVPVGMATICGSVVFLQRSFSNLFGNSPFKFLSVLIVPTIFELRMVLCKLFSIDQPILQFIDGLTFKVPRIGW